MVFEKVGKNKWRLLSHEGKPLSKPGSLEKIKRREKQVRKFKHAKMRKDWRSTNF
jgi:hypothetical protein